MLMFFGGGGGGVCSSSSRRLPRNSFHPLRFLLLAALLVLHVVHSSVAPTARPSPRPTVRPTPQPTNPTARPTPAPSPRPSPKPTAPSPVPTISPTPRPTATPTLTPTQRPTSAAGFNYWSGDDISILFGGNHYAGPWRFNVTALSNGPIYSEDAMGNSNNNNGGHFSLSFHVITVDYGNLTGTTPCISFGSTGSAVNTIIANTLMNTSSNSSDMTRMVLPLSQLVRVNTQRAFHATSSISTKTTFVITLAGVTNEIRGYEGVYLYASMTTNNCSVPMTIGYWNDPLRWTKGVVPNATNSVSFPSTTGVVVIPASVTVQTFVVNGGLFIAHNSTCPPGWSPSSPGSSVSTKCYKLYSQLKSFDDAEQTCQSSGLGSSDAHLAHISSYSDLSAVLGVCRGEIGSNAYDHGCWIGLRDLSKTSTFQWMQPPTLAYDGFRDWRRYEPNNHTFSEGQSTNGEQCVQVVPWQEDPLILEQGSFNDVDCLLLKPFVCQTFSSTYRSTINVMGPSAFTGGGMIGGIVNLRGASSLTNFFIQRGGAMTLAANKSISSLAYMNLEDGSSLTILSSIVSTGAVFVGELPSSTGIVNTLQTNFQILGGSWTMQSAVGKSGFDANVASRVLISVSVTVGSAVSLTLSQGGSVSAASFVLASNTTTLVLGGYGMKLSTYDAFELKLSQRGPVVGEYKFSNVLYESQDYVWGVYKLLVSAVGANGVVRRNVSSCLSYWASAEDVASSLNALGIINAYGSVTVRRYGDGNSSLYAYGYTHRIELDSTPTALFTAGGGPGGLGGPLSISVYCYGIVGCGCAETKVPLEDPAGVKSCPMHGGNSSRSDPFSCVIAPSITVTRISSLSYTITSGSGALVIGKGVHRLPPYSNVLITSAASGVGICGADFIHWGGIGIAGVGRVIIAGTSWASWDSASWLFAPEWTPGRGLVKYLTQAPPFNMIVDSYTLSGLGSVATASPHSNMSWGSGTWNGGIIGGRSTLTITGNMTAKGTNKALRYGITLVLSAQATLSWSHGNISLANGANIIIKGKVTFETVGDRQFIGEAILLDAPPGDDADHALLEQLPGRQWHGYYGRELTPELRGGWYQNPLCGAECERTNTLLVTDNGILRFIDNSNTTFSLPLNLLGSSSVVMGHAAYVEVASGGICGNQVVVSISNGTYFIFSGGQMQMERSCQITGQGELQVVGGEHYLSYVIQSHITISGGAMIWPQSRGPGLAITFNGGLLIENNGILQVEPTSTKIDVYNEVVFRDNSLLQFPMIGTAAQASNSDAADAPDPSPRGVLTAHGIMRWDGGTLRGKADFVSSSVLYIGGGLKQIRSLAKLVNQGHAEWEAGDIIMADNANFVNFGSIQMANGSSLFAANDVYQGTVVPTENGGDLFALNYHSYDLDQGGLSYVEYVELRTVLVSRAPKGWTPADQSSLIVTPDNIN